ncbi:MAG: MYXO-CTERM sorting domain-containing protein [Deltaproteobacteria bacterium]|nr:MYXO-CTERM sorting domain-containing protein [Deltaproteobacteria bacterium]
MMQHQSSRASVFNLAVAAAFLLPLAFSSTSAAQSMCTSPNDTQCYRLLCNSMEANGLIEDDDRCGSCTAGNSPRWDNATVPVRVDLSTVPSDLTTTEWTNVVNSSFSLWADVQGSTLNFQNVGNATNRTFGEDRNTHEIFWVNSATEFQNKVGFGANGALGVTVTPYYCSGSGRPISDSDLIMNGAGGFEWADFASNCNGGWCNSAVSTLLHELGHFVGLGHPCTACSWSLMSATSAYETEVPTNVDRAAVGILYPGTPGGIGYGCSSDSDCGSAPICATVGELSYCTESCGTCPDGFSCTEVTGEGDVCVFAGGALAPPAEIGASCPSGVCVGGASCVYVGDATVGVCFENCTPNGSDCPDDYTCLELQNGGGACFETSGDQEEGELCSPDALCGENLICSGSDTDPYTCHAICSEPWIEAGCANGQLCVGLADVDYGACYNMGNAPEGGVCESPLECSAGNLCLDDEANASHCYATCTTIEDCVDSRQTCQDLNGVSVSICDPLLGSLVGEDPNPGPDEEPDAGPDVSPGPGVEPEPEPGECRTSRGNYDCPTGEGCVGTGGTGVCEAGAEGEAGLGGLCETSADCNSGLCHNGVCTRPCDDEGCEDGFACDDDAIPGGLCEAESCDGADICAEGWTCEYTSADRYACARGVDQGIVCACVIGDSDTSPPQAGLALLLLVGLGTFRRRQRK